MGVVAPYMNVFMAKPLGAESQPGFCLSTYPTDNRFNYKHCLTRWDFITDIFRLEGSIVKNKTI